LARESAADKIDGREIIGSDRSNVAVSNSVREPSFEDGASERVDLDLPGSSHSGSLESQIESADSCEEGANGQHSLWPISDTSKVCKWCAVRPQIDAQAPSAIRAGESPDRQY